MAKKKNKSNHNGSSSSTKTSVKKSRKENRSFRQLASNFAASAAISSVDLVERRRKHGRMSGITSSTVGTKHGIVVASSSSIGGGGDSNLTAKKAKIMSEDCNDLEIGYRNLFERDYMQQQQQRTLTKRERHRIELSLKRHRQHSKSSSNEHNKNSARRRSSCGDILLSPQPTVPTVVTAPALSCLFAFQPPTFDLVPKTTTDLIRETADTFHSVGLQEAQSKLGGDNPSTKTDSFIISSSFLQQQPSSITLAESERKNALRQSNDVNSSSNRFHVFAADDEEENHRGVASTTSSLFTFAPPTFAVPTTMSSSTTTNQEGTDEIIDPDL